MKSATRRTLFTLISGLCILRCPTSAYVPSKSAYPPRNINQIHHVSSLERVKSLASNDGSGESDDSMRNDQGIVRGSMDEISDETWRDLEGSAPSQWMVMKDVSTLL
jgi:hypothetical protein